MIRCSIIVLNYNGKRFLDDCLQSVLRQTSDDVEVLFVDNASTDGSVEFVRERFPSVRVFSLEENFGFAEGNNIGARNASGEIVVLLNNDTIVEDGWLASLREALAPDDVAIAQSLVFTDGVPMEYYERNGSVNPLGHNIMRIFENPEDVFYATGASLAYKKSLLSLPFDPDYFAYAEDLYLGMRARFLGLRIVHVNASRVRHFGGGATKSLVPSWIRFLQERNRLLTMRLFFSRAARAKMAPYIAANFIGKCLASLFSRRYSFVATVRAYAWLATNRSLIEAKRRALSHEKRVDEKDVLRFMTCRVTNGESLVGRVLNRCAEIYCRLVRLRTIEADY